MTNDIGLDYRPLSAPVDRDTVTAFRRRVKAAGEPWAVDTAGMTVVSLIAVTIVCICLVPVISSFVRSANGSVYTTLFVSIGAVVIVVVGALCVHRYSTGPRGRWARWYRLDRFATANGLRAIPQSGGSDFPGSIFQIGSGRMSTDRVQTISGRQIDIGSYSYTTGSGKSKRTHSWGYLAIRLDRNLPHMVLDAKSNNGLFGGTNLPAKFGGGQVLSLEGDFDR